MPPGHPLCRRLKLASPWVFRLHPRRYLTGVRPENMFPKPRAVSTWCNGQFRRSPGAAMDLSASEVVFMACFHTALPSFEPYLKDALFAPPPDLVSTHHLFALRHP